MNILFNYLIIYIIICINPIGLIIGSIYSIIQDSNDRDTFFVFFYWPFLLMLGILLLFKLPFKKTYHSDPYNGAGLL